MDTIGKVSRGIPHPIHDGVAIVDSTTAQIDEEADQVPHLGTTKARGFNEEPHITHGGRSGPILGRNAETVTVQSFDRHVVVPVHSCLLVNEGRIIVRAGQHGAVALEVGVVQRPRTDPAGVGVQGGPEQVRPPPGTDGMDRPPRLAVGPGLPTVPHGIGILLTDHVPARVERLRAIPAEHGDVFDADVDGEAAVDGPADVPQGVAALVAALVAAVVAAGTGTTSVWRRAQGGRGEENRDDLPTSMHAGIGPTGESEFHLLPVPARIQLEGVLQALLNCQVHCQRSPRRAVEAPPFEVTWIGRRRRRQWWGRP